MKMKNFSIFGVTMFISSIITCCLFYIVLRTCLGIIFFDWLWTFFICPPFLLGAIIVWKISNNNWISLATRQIIATNILLILIMAIFCIGKDKMTIGYASMFSLIVALSSIFPILIGCYCYKRLISH